MCPGKDSETIWDDPKFIPQSDPGQEDGLQQSRTHTHTHTHTQIENRREFDLSSLGIGDNPISIVTTLYDLNFQFSRTTKPQGIKNKV